MLLTEPKKKLTKLFGRNYVAKMRCILALCGTMAFVLAGCGSEIVESAVTETQVIDVNEPSAAEHGKCRL